MKLSHAIICIGSQTNIPMNNKSNAVNIMILALLLTAVGTASLVTNSNMRKAVNDQKQSFDDKITVLQKQISALQNEITKITGENSKVALSLHEIQNRQQVREKSQDELLTEAVSKIAPTVVSIVISKDVPKLEITYQNPFGDDPFFKNFGFQIPVYQQKGVEYKKIGAGTGFIITSDGYVLTNKHVVADTTADYTVLLADGSQKPATVSYKDPENDIAIIKIGGSGYATARLGDSSALKLGQTVVAIGNALGEYNNSVSVGIISGLDRTIEASSQSGGSTEQLTGVIQTDAAINPGNSGGPLVDTSGNVVGVNVATVIGSNNISFAIPSNVVKTITRKVLGI
jgi:S1-C subfamily serine protease